MEANALVLYGSLFLLMASPSIEKRLPRRLQRVLARVHSVESFQREFKFDPKREHEEELSTLLARSGHVNELEGPIVELDNEVCSSRPVVVAVPQPDHKQGFYFPFYVKLHRCTGACQAKPIITQCVANEVQPLNLMVYTIFWSSSRQRVEDMEKGVLTVGMMNHTSCKCRCITRPSDCDPQTQEFDENKCRCVCKNRPSGGCPPNYLWDHNRCQCRCNMLEGSCPTRHQLDSESCSCVCSTKKCRYGKVRNPNNCRCYCSKSLKTCPGGTERDPRNCRCKFGSLRLQSEQFRRRQQ